MGVVVKQDYLDTVSVIVTVLNEANSVESLLHALSFQTLQPTEVIVVDGGSVDETIKIVSQFSQKNPAVQIYKKVGSRSVGRNFAISKASAQIIAITDAGCIPDFDWLEQLVAEYRVGRQHYGTNDVVVAGYYRPERSTPLAAAAAAYALTPPHKVRASTFLPATRSMLLPKSVWRAAGGFDEAYSDNEDYVFSRKLADQGVPMVFAEAAQVVWQPPTSLQQFATMIFRFARGDAKAGLRRVKVGTVFVRYIFATLWLLISIYFLNIRFLILWCLAGAAYLTWAVLKNYHFARSGWYWLPVLQVASDGAVIFGTLAGIQQSKN